MKNYLRYFILIFLLVVSGVLIWLCFFSSLLDKRETKVSNLNDGGTKKVELIDCGSISLEDYVSIMFGAENAPLKSGQAVTSIECINRALVNCTPAKLTVADADFKNGEFIPNNNPPKILNVATATASNMCMLNDCIMPKEAISHRSEIDKQGLIFSLIGFSPQEEGLKVDHEDMYDPVTKTVIKNVCPPQKNPLIF